MRSLRKQGAFPPENFQLHDYGFLQLLRHLSQCFVNITNPNKGGCRTLDCSFNRNFSFFGSRMVSQGFPKLQDQVKSMLEDTSRVTFVPGSGCYSQVSSVRWETTVKQVVCSGLEPVSVPTSPGKQTYEVRLTEGTQCRGRWYWLWGWTSNGGTITLCLDL